VDYDLASFAKKRSGAKVPPLTELRQKLASYEGEHLNGWRDTLMADDVPAGEVHAALVEVMNSVTGPGGLWSKVPNQWFGCAADAETEVCQAFASLRKQLEPWEKFQAKVENAPADPARFLKRNHKKIMKYLAIYVPTARNFDAVKATPLFSKHVAPVL
jgi:hypothetical protein